MYGRKPFKKTFSTKKNPQRVFSSQSFKKDLKAFRKQISAVAERKNVDSNQGGGIDSVGTLYSMGLDGLAQGAGNLARLGNEITIRSISYKAELIVGDATNKIRCILFQWLAESASLTVLNNVIFNNSIAGFTTLSSYAKEYSGKFKILDDRLISLNTVNRPNITFEVMVNKGFMPSIRYNSQVAGNLVVKGAIYLLVLSDSNLAPNPTIGFESRITFTDV